MLTGDDLLVRIDRAALGPFRPPNLGTHHTVEEFVERGAQMLHNEKDLLSESKGAIHKEIGLAIEALDRGEGIPGDVSRARLQEKKSEWVKSPFRSS